MLPSLTCMLTYHNFKENYIWDSSRENDPWRLIKWNKNALRLNHYNFRTIKAIGFIFLPLHNTPFLHRIIYFGVLNYLLAIVAWSDTPRGSRPPYI